MANIAKIPSKNINKEDNKVLKNLEKNIRLSVFGQDRAIKEPCRVVRLSRSGLRDDDKTIGSYLFVWAYWSRKNRNSKGVSKCFKCKITKV